LAEALAHGLIRLAEFLDARYLDVSMVEPPVLRKRIQAATPAFQPERRSRASAART
jgi:hypothetical protein